MKICFIVGAFPLMKCGVGDYTCCLAKEMAKQGNEVHIITSTKANAKSDTLQIHNIVEKWDLSEKEKILNKLQEIKPDMVNIQYPSNEYTTNYLISVILPLEIKKKIKCKLSLTLHEFDCHTFKTKVRLYLNYKKTDKIIVAEEEFKEKVKTVYKKANVEYIPISANIPRSKMTEEDKKKLLESYQLTGKKVISYFGFAGPTKGIEYLLKVMPKLEKNVKLLFIGALEVKNEYHQSILELIKKLGIEDRVIITGFFDSEEDVADRLQISDVCVLPFVKGVKTRNGSFLAAFNQKIPVITTSNDLTDKDDIYYVKPNEEKELEDKIKEVLNKSHNIERKILTWEKTAKSYIESFKEVI